MEIYVMKYRQQRGLSTRRLAALSKVSRTHIVNIENGITNPTLDVMCKLAVALQVDVHKLFKC